MLPIEYSVYRINWRKYAPKSRQGKAEPEAPASGEIGFYLPPPPSFRSSTRVQCTIQLGQEKVAQVPHQSVSQSVSFSLHFFLSLSQSQNSKSRLLGRRIRLTDLPADCQNCNQLRKPENRFKSILLRFPILKTFYR